MEDDALDAGIRLDRQERQVAVDARGRPIVPQRVPETRPTVLQNAFIYLSIVVLVCGIVAIAALELGTPIGAPIVKLPVLAGGVVLLALTVDAIVRVWRAAWAWMGVDRGRGLFRLVWDAVLVLSLVIVAGILVVVASA